MIQQMQFLKSDTIHKNHEWLSDRRPIIFLQKHERARQGRIRALCMKKIQCDERKRLQRLKKGIVH
jgi:hypothetical protein